MELRSVEGKIGEVHLLDFKQIYGIIALQMIASHIGMRWRSEEYD